MNVKRGNIHIPSAASPSPDVPLSLGSPSRSSTEQGLSSLPSLEMVRKDVGDTDWERLLLLLPRSAPPGVCVSTLRVLLLLWTSGGGARCPSGISCGCNNRRTQILRLSQEDTQTQAPPPQDPHVENPFLGCPVRFTTPATSSKCDGCLGASITLNKLR